MNISILAENIKRIREAKGITSYKLARLSGVGESTLSLIENGKRKSVTIATVEKIARALKVTPDELLISKVNEEYIVEDLYDTLEIIFSSDELKLDGFLLSSIEKEYLKIRMRESIDILLMLKKVFSANGFDITKAKDLGEIHEIRKKIFHS